MVVGVVRRRALAAANQAYAAASDGRSLIADLQDGFGVELEVEVSANAAQKLMAILQGEAGTLPLSLKAKIDPSVDTE